MKNLLNPKWIFIINTLPVIILYFIFIREYQIIKSLLEPKNLKYWVDFGTVLAFFTLLNFFYALTLVFLKKQISPIYGAISLLIYIPFLYIYSVHAADVIPFTIPAWMLPNNMFVSVGTFLMPTLAYSLFILVLAFTPEKKEGQKDYKTWLNFVFAIGIPLFWYLFFQVIFPFWNYVDNEFSTHALIIFIIILTVLFLFFLVRGLYLISTKKSKVFKKYQLLWKIPFAFIFPLLGLLLNNGYIFSKLSYNSGGIFGDFNNFWFYILAAFTGILMCLPEAKNKNLRIFLFIAKSITLAFTVYFIIVFLPFLPLSILLIAAFGLGFLTLSPLILFVIHISEMSKDFVYLQSLFSKKMLWLIAFMGFILIPVLITINYSTDKKVLNKTLDYVYSPDYSKNYKFKNKRIDKILKNIKSNKNNERGMLFGTRIPYLSSFYNWIVLDNLTLSESKIKKIDNIFSNNSDYIEYNNDIINNENVKITDLTSNCIYDSVQNVWKSTIDFEITNTDSASWRAEYYTSIELPEGCWISDYYLFVGDKKESGILAEKKSALWVFLNIKNENRDPGILYYEFGNIVAFRVFPFAPNEVRNTGIELIHKEPIELIIDNQHIKLGDSTKKIISEYNNSFVDYVSVEKKSKLNIIKRKPYYCFVVDASYNADKSKNDFISRIENLLSKNLISSENAQIYFAGTFVKNYPLASDWKDKYNELECSGGFYLDRAIKTILYNSYIENSGNYPVIVVVTDTLYKAVLENSYADLEFTFPESELFIELTKDNRLVTHSLLNNRTNILSDSIKYDFDAEALIYEYDNGKTAYLPNNNKPSIVLKQDKFDINIEEIKPKEWNSALLMQAKWMMQQLHPEISQIEWQNLVKYSFMSQIMTPVTSFIVVENDAQKEILKRKQKQVLSGNVNLDAGENPVQQMSEPGIILLSLILFFLLALLKKRKKTKIT